MPRYNTFSDTGTSIQYFSPLHEMYSVSARPEFLGSLMTPCLKIWGSLTNLEGQNFFFNISFQFHESECIVISYGPL